MNVEHGTFTPLVIGTNGGMGVECSKFLANLAEMLSKKQNEEYSDVMGWLRTKLSFEVLRAAILCVRGSRRPWHRQDTVKISEDFGLRTIEAGLGSYQCYGEGFLEDTDCELRILRVLKMVW